MTQSGKAAPYPPEIRAKGWRFELDYEQIEQSSTWALAKAEAKPWLLMLWMTSWKQTPCGALPADEEVIAAMIGAPPSLWTKYKKTLMRGWWQADDGRLYHDTLTKRVLEMMQRRRKESDRKAAARAKTPKGSHGSHEEVPPVSHGTPPGFHPESDTGTGTGTGNTAVLSSSSTELLPEVGDDQKPSNPAEWISVFAKQHGVDIDHCNYHDRKKFWPLATAWTKAGISVGQMREACAKAYAEAKEPIAWLPAYADRVLASMQSRKPASETESFRERDARIARERFQEACGIRNAATTDPRDVIDITPTTLELSQ